jgi:hypothetical protein
MRGAITTICILAVQAMIHTRRSSICDRYQLLYAVFFALSTKESKPMLAELGPPFMQFGWARMVIAAIPSYTIRTGRNSPAIKAWPPLIQYKKKWRSLHQSNLAAMRLNVCTMRKQVRVSCGRWLSRPVSCQSSGTFTSSLALFARSFWSISR